MPPRRCPRLHYPSKNQHETERAAATPRPADRFKLRQADPKDHATHGSFNSWITRPWITRLTPLKGRRFIVILRDVASICATDQRPLAASGT
jgi:hypothetical protein